MEFSHGGQGMKKHIGALCAVGGGALWGMMGIFVRYFSGEGLGSLETGQIRVTFGFAAVMVYMLIFRRDLLKIKLKDAWCFAGAGIGSVLLVCWSYFKAMQYISLAAAGVLLYTAPIFVTLLSALLFKEKITVKTVAALVLAFFGCVLVSGLGSESALPTVGVLLGLCAGVGYSLYSIFGRYAVKLGYGAWPMTAYSFLFAMIAGAFLCDWELLLSVMSKPQSLLYALGLGVGTCFAPYILYSTSLEYLPGSTASILASVEPVVAAIISVLMFAEPFSLASLAGTVLVLGAVVLTSVRFTKKKAEEAA